MTTGFLAIANIVNLNELVTGNGPFRKGHYHKQWNQPVSVSGKYPYIRECCVATNTLVRHRTLSLCKRGQE